MGVKGFRKIIELGNCVKKKQFKDYYDMTEALDAPQTLYKFCIAIINTENFKSPDGIITGHLFAAFFKTSAMLRYGIKPLWIFDGNPPPIKNDTLNERRMLKERALLRLSQAEHIYEKNMLEKKTFKLTCKQIEEIKYLLTLMGIQYMVAPSEAEAQCAALNIANVANGVVTEDWDALLFGCKTMLKDFSNKCIVTEINGATLLKNLGMTKEQLIDLGIILGTDYCDGILGLKPVDAYKKFKIAKFNMEKFLENLSKENEDIYKYEKYKIPYDFKCEHEKAKDFYLNAPVASPTQIKVTWNEPKYEIIIDYLVNKKKFNREIIFKKINELRLLYNYFKNNVDQSGEKHLVTLSKILFDTKIKARTNHYKNNMFIDDYPNMYDNLPQNNKKISVSL